MQTIELSLSLDEVNQILDALGQQPFVKVHQVIAKIQQQATQQLQSRQPGAAPEDSTRQE